MLPGLVRQQALDRIEWHKRQGGVDVICTQLEEQRGTLTGRYVRGDCCGAEKVRRIRERYDLDRYELIYAYGDTADDREMLGIAHRKYYRWTEISATSKTG